MIPVPEMTPVGLPPAFDPATLRDLGVPHRRPFALRHRPDASMASPGIPHVNNLIFIAWMDRAADLHAASLGYTRNGMADADTAWFVGRHEISYHAEAWPGDELLVLTWIDRMHRFTAEREVLVVRTAAAADPPGRPAAVTDPPTPPGPVICRGRTSWVLVTLSTSRPRRHDAAMVAAFDPLHRGSPAPDPALEPAP